MSRQRRQGAPPDQENARPVSGESRSGQSLQRVRMPEDAVIVNRCGPFTSTVDTASVPSTLARRRRQDGHASALLTLSIVFAAVIVLGVNVLAATIGWQATAMLAAGLAWLLLICLCRQDSRPAHHHSHHHHHQKTTLGGLR